jgi:hypothetical protein
LANESNPLGKSTLQVDCFRPLPFQRTPCIKGIMRNTLRLLLTLAMLTMAYGRANATDLTKIDRSIPKEPAYHTKPKYCLLVFGPEAKDRVWLVQDGVTLYINVNGGEDWLTQPARSAVRGAVFTLGWSGEKFRLRELRVGERVHRDLEFTVEDMQQIGRYNEHAKALVKKDPKAKAYYLNIYLEVPGFKGTGPDGRVKQIAEYRDRNGCLQFADRPQDAPILHFGGNPRGMLELLDGSPIQIGRENTLSVSFGSVGIGPGTTTIYELQGAPKGVHPTLEFTFPPKIAGEPSVREKYDLKGRWYGDFRGPVRIPDTVGAGKAKVAISFDSWPGPKFVPTQLEVSVVLPKKNEIKGEKSNPEK